MNCFNHSEIPAVVICKSCGKGLCHDCHESIDNGFTCKDESCKTRGILLNRMVDNNVKVLHAANTQVKKSGISAIIMGCFMIVFAIIAYFQMPGSFICYFLLTIAIGVISTGISRLKKRNQYPEE